MRNTGACFALLAIILIGATAPACAPRINNAIGAAAGVVLPAVTLTSPVGGESYRPGSTQTITWTLATGSHLGSTPIYLDYSIDAGATWLSLAGPIANTGSYSWSAGPQQSGQFRVRVRAVDSRGNTSASGTASNLAVQFTQAERWVGSTAGSGATDATGTSAQFNQPVGMASDGAGNLYVADRENHTIRKIVIATQVVTTIAGTAFQIGTTDGTGAAARFYLPSGVAYKAGGSGTLYVTDSGNHTIRKIDLFDNSVTTYAGLAGTSGTTTGAVGTARFNAPVAIYYDATHDFLYVGDTGSSRFRAIDLGANTVTTEETGITVSGIASADDSTFYMISDGNLYSWVRATSTLTLVNGMAYAVSIVANTATQFFIGGTYDFYSFDPSGPTLINAAGGIFRYGWEDGAAASARFHHLSGMAINGGTLYATDRYNHKIRTINTGTFAASTFAGTEGSKSFTDSADPTLVRFRNARYVTGDSTYLYVVDQFSDNGADGTKIRKINRSTGVTTTLATALINAWGTALEGTTLYVTKNHGVHTFNTTTGAATDLFQGGFGSTDGAVGVGATCYPNAPVVPPGSYAYFMECNGKLRSIHKSSGDLGTLSGSAGPGYADGAAGVARFGANGGAMVYVGDYLYFTDDSNHSIRKISINDGSATTFAGLSGTSGTTDGSATAARFNRPHGITSDGTYFYVIDVGTRLLRRVKISTGEVVTLSGQSPYSREDYGLGIASASLESPNGPFYIDSYLYMMFTNALIRLR